VQPLAWNGTLAATAQQQSQYESDHQIQTHQGPDELNLEQRLDAAGYGNRLADGENSYAYSNSVDHAMKAFLIDWGVPDHGHRNNLLQSGVSGDQTYAEVGIGIVATGSGSKVGPFVMTQDFGRQQGAQAQVVGVVYNDKNGDSLYSLGEGVGNVTIEVDNASGQKVSTTTWDAGGYQIPLAPGSYKVTALVNNEVVRTQDITIGSQNVAVDYNLSLPWQGGTLPDNTKSSTDNTGGSGQGYNVSEGQNSQSDSSKSSTDNTGGSGQSYKASQGQNSQNDASQVAMSPPNFEGSWLSSWSWWKKS
jgi:uncharacterized protein YkwD